jgi:hypothetical protein
MRLEQTRERGGMLLFGRRGNGLGTESGGKSPGKVPAPGHLGPPCTFSAKRREMETPARASGSDQPGKRTARGAVPPSPILREQPARAGCPHAPSPDPCPPSRGRRWPAAVLSSRHCQETPARFPSPGPAARPLPPPLLTPLIPLSG